MDDVGKEILNEEQASANYRMRQVQVRRSGALSWEVVDANTGVTVATGLVGRDEALRLVRAWERLSQKIDGGLDGHVLVN